MNGFNGQNLFTRGMIHNLGVFYAQLSGENTCGHRSPRGNCIWP